VATNQALQRTLLDKARTLVKPGGSLVYSVCSPMRAEGAAHIDEMLAAGFVLDVARRVLPFLPADAVDDRGCVHLWPHRHDADAFFCARFIRPI
jgi:16S rRNA (cytosine967-C5)-methyltransferase